MKRTREQKGITLVALIVTIVVLLILAVVAITAVQNDGILGHANSAASEYTQKQEQENTLLNGYEGLLNNYIGNGGSGSDPEGTAIGDAEVGIEVTSLSTINGGQYTANNPVIPAGFMAINTDTNWEAEDLAAEVKKGLVISDGTSEFVWIPVANINEMAKVTSGTDANGRINYEGVLYDFTSTGATEKSDYGQSTTSYREPANLTDATIGDNAGRFTTITWTENLYQESFNKMVESVAEYKGFYVGRYEMSISASGKAQSASGATSVYNDSDENNWWGLYEKAKTYSTSGVISEMIWGCQWDAMMKWMQSNSIDVTSKTPTDTSRGVTASNNTTRVTGSSSDDLLNNVYDILGNSWEYSQDALRTFVRGSRGGYFRFSYAPSSNVGYRPTSSDGAVSSRLTLYIEM